jgi:hypothetical protein
MRPRSPLGQFLAFREKPPRRSAEKGGDMFCFRILFRRSPRERLAVDDSSIEIAKDSEGNLIKLSALESEKSVKESEELVLSGCGYRTEEDAELAGRVFRRGLALALARNLIGADFGSRGPSSAITPMGLQHFASQFGLAGPVAQDRYGMSVHEKLPNLHFIKMGDVSPIVTKPLGKLVEELLGFVAVQSELSTAEEVAFEFFSASFFQASADARFLLLMTAIETLIEPRKRSTQARAHVDSLIAITSGNEDLRDEERLSIEGSLRFLKRESFRQAGKRTATERLGDREYEGKTAPEYFSDCYDVRSKLVHGIDPIPTWEEVNQMNGSLQQFVSDLLTAPWEKRNENA